MFDVGTMFTPSFSIYTLSLGKHVRLSDRLRAAASAGFTHIELDTEDWYSYAKTYCATNGLTFESAVDQIIAGKALSAEICSLGLKVLCLQPFRHFEGLLDEKMRETRISEALALFRVMSHLKTDLLLIPSSFLPSHLISDDLDRVASDLRELADLAASVDPKLRIGYEALAWGTYVDRWQQAWDVIQQVNRPNAGLVLDSFNLLGRVYADPTMETGTCDNADFAYRSSLAELVITVPASRIFLVQIADGARPSPQFDTQVHLPRLIWSRSSRLFPGEFERGAYLPVEAFMKSVVTDIGFQGPWSLEYFNIDLERHENGHGVASELAGRGMHSLKWLSNMINGPALAPKYAVLHSPQYPKLSISYDMLSNGDVKSEEICEEIII